MSDISVVIPCYQAQTTINRCVQSVVNQQYLPKELIIINDGSDDDTQNKLLAIQRQWHEPFALKVIKHAVNQGVATARNTGWDAATGDWVAFLDADDCWHPEKLALQSSWMRSHPEADLTCHDMSTMMQKSQETFQSRRLSKKTLLFKNQVLTSTVMVKRKIQYRFNEGQQYSEDYDLWLQLAFNRLTLYYLDMPMAQRFKAPYGESGLSQRLWAMEQNELRNYVTLYRQQHISLLMCITASSFSLMKFFRRIIRRFLQTLKHMPKTI